MKILKITVFLFLFVFSCAKKEVSYEYPNNQDYERNSRAGSFLEEDLVLFGAKKQDEAKKNNSEENELANSKLWRSSVQVIGALFPISLVDSESGIIATEWYQENVKSKKRVKINAIIKGSQATAQNIRISVFHQRKIGDNWQGDGSESSEEEGGLTSKLIKEKILKAAKK